MQPTAVLHVVTTVAVRVKVDAEVLAEVLVVAVRIIAEVLVALAAKALVVAALVRPNSFYVMDLIMEVRLAKT